MDYLVKNLKVNTERFSREIGTMKAAFSHMPWSTLRDINDFNQRVCTKPC